MAKADDSSLPEHSLAQVRKKARRLLAQSDALGVFPTPVDAILDAVKLTVDDQTLGDHGVLSRLRQKAEAGGKALLRALDKILGVFHPSSSTVYIDPATPDAKRPFLKMHEAGHAFLPWQRDLFALTEDCTRTMDPEVAIEYEREANTFATEVIFQLDAFNNEANEHGFCIKVPMRLTSKYGGSVYMGMRRYVRGHDRACAVLVLEPPKRNATGEYESALRRREVSKKFSEILGPIQWPERFASSTAIGRLIPVGKQRMSRPQQIELRDAAGKLHECVAEGFTQGYQVFVLIHSVKTLTRRTLVLTA